jgi:predicted amidohydrolase YtcJ
VLLDRDIFEIDPTELDKVRVAVTIVDGKVVWEAK